MMTYDGPDLPQGEICQLRLPKVFTRSFQQAMLKEMTGAQLRKDVSDNCWEEPTKATTSNDTTSCAALTVALGQPCTCAASTPEKCGLFVGSTKTITLTFVGETRVLECGAGRYLSVEVNECRSCLAPTQVPRAAQTRVARALWR